MPDLLYKRFRRDIKQFYRDDYVGDGREICQYHLSTLKRYYNADRFTNCLDLNKERVEFLTELQNIVNVGLTFCNTG